MMLASVPNKDDLNLTVITCRQPGELSIDCGLCDFLPDYIGSCEEYNDF